MTFRAAVGRAWDEPPSLRGLVLDAPDAAARHERAGQYVKVSAGTPEEGTYFALANAPGSQLELLVKRGGGRSQALAVLESGAEVSVGEPTGRGFPIEEHRGANVLLF